MTIKTDTPPVQEVSPRPPRSAQSPARPRRITHNKAEKRAPWLLLTPFLVIFLITFIGPIVYAIVQSFTRVQRLGLFGENGRTVQFAGLENYVQALGNSAFIDSIWRMLLFGVVQVPLMIALAVVLAVILESASVRWPGLFRTMFFLPYGVPGVIASILWSFLYVPGLSPIVDLLTTLGFAPDFLGETTVLWSIANIVTWSYTGYNMLIIIAQLKAIPTEIYEASRIDGAGAFRTFFNIQLPLIRPAITLTVVFSIIGTLQLFAEPQVLRKVSSSIDTQYTPNMASYTSAFTNNDFNVAAAQAVLIALTAAVLSFTFLRLTNRKDSDR